jgi:hypothetical protein
MTIDLVRNGHVMATVDLEPGDTFAMHADGEPVAGVLGDQTILSWSTLTSIVDFTFARLANGDRS